MPHDVVWSLCATLFQIVFFNLIPFIAIYWIKRVVID